jgi:hypothetical protein
MPWNAWPLEPAPTSSSMIKFRLLQARAAKWEKDANRILIWERNANIHCEESNETGSVTLK